MRAAAAVVTRSEEASRILWLESWKSKIALFPAPGGKLSYSASWMHLDVLELALQVLTEAGIRLSRCWSSHLCHVCLSVHHCLQLPVWKEEKAFSLWPCVMDCFVWVMLSANVLTEREVLLFYNWNLSSEVNVRSLKNRVEFYPRQFYDNPEVIGGWWNSHSSCCFSRLSLMVWPRSFSVLLNEISETVMWSSFQLNKTELQPHTVTVSWKADGDTFWWNAERDGKQKRHWRVLRER
jgi:hypothetical protein